MYTYHYAQPEGYHFSKDTIHLAHYVAERLNTRVNLSDIRVLDLCAGCGVLGFELSYHVPTLRFIDFLEVQEVYSAYFNKNAALIQRPELSLKWYLLNYDILLESQWANKYDVIICNPPYFLPEHSMLSPNEFKNRCRFFLDSTFQNFVLAMANTLAPGGQAYFLLRSLQEHGVDLFAEVQQILQHDLVKLQQLGSIRGTDVILLEKHRLVP